MKNDEYNQILIIRNTKTEKVFVRINEEFFALGCFNIKEGLDVFSRFILKQKESFAFNFHFSVANSDMEVIVTLEESRFDRIYESLSSSPSTFRIKDFWIYKDSPGESKGCTYCLIEPSLTIPAINAIFSTKFLSGEILIGN